MIHNKLFLLVSLTILMHGCNTSDDANDALTDADTTTLTDKFVYQTEQFGDVKILRYQVPGFEELSLKEKELLYYLYEAALAGRDIIWDQHFKHNLYIRRTLEAIVSTYTGNRDTEEFEKFMVYTKKVWFSSGIHHYISTSKTLPEFSENYFAALIRNSDEKEFPFQEDETTDDLIAKLSPIMFDPKTFAKRVNLDPDVDLVTNSANNFYEGVTQQEVEAYYSSIKEQDNPTPVSYGLNTKVIKENGKVIEKVWRVGGMYTQAIEKIVYWLEKASAVAENEKQQAALDKLVEYYKTGDLKTFDEYSIAWVEDANSRIDVINGFIEVYGDPLGYKGSFESVVSIRDPEASKRIIAIGNEAQWFEDNSPLMDEHKKKNVTGISAKVINVVMESGDASPTTPIGINLPNANWIRANHGSKSVNLANIVHAYDESKKGGGFLEEFAYSKEEIERAKADAGYSDMLHTDLHEVIGHASGQINEGVGTPKETLKNYSNTLEEARADLVSLYYLPDQKLIDIGIMETFETAKAAYDDYIRTGLMTQLTRLKLGEQLEQAHMRNRQLVAAWAYEKGANEKVVEKIIKDGKTYFVINDYDKLRMIFGDLLREIQRIKSEGDYEAGKNLVEGYGVKVDPELHKEVLERFGKLGIAPYSGFINPMLIAVYDGDKIIDVKIEFPDDFTEQMMHYAKHHSLLPTYN